MSIVLRHKISGLYYQAAGNWVRCADNALVFESARSARRYARQNHLPSARPVPRLAPYLLTQLRQPRPGIWKTWSRGADSGWLAGKASHFGHN